jgi:hypothetical protein
MQTLLKQIINLAGFNDTIINVVDSDAIRDECCRPERQT